MSRFFKSICLLICTAPLFLAAPSRAQDRAGSLGQTFSFPRDFEPATRNVQVYNLDFGFSYSERWWGTLSWEIGLNHSQRMSLAFGARCYLLLYPLFKPYAGVSFLYSIDPKNDIGWRGGFGFDYDLVKVTGYNNLRFEFFSGASSYIINNSPDTYTFELARVGLSWSY